MVFAAFAYNSQKRKGIQNWLLKVAKYVFSFPVVIPDFRSLVPLFLKAFDRKWFNLIADRDFKLSLSYVSLRLVSIVDSMVMGNNPSVALGGQKLS